MMFNFIKNLFKSDKHNYKYVGIYKFKLSPDIKTASWPVYTCDKCNHKLNLEHFQVASLPREMQYGCEGVKP